MNPLSIILLMIISSGSIYGQHAKSELFSKHKKIVRTQGMQPYTNIHCSLQDQDGNIWVGTTGEGIYRYDGKYFTNYTTAEGLSSNTIWSMLEDKAGNIWIGTDVGLCKFNRSGISAISFYVADAVPDLFASPAKPTGGKNEVWSIMQDRKGILWFGTRERIYCYDGISFTRFLDDRNIANPNGLQLKMVDCMLQDRNGVIWLGGGMLPGGEGICRFDGKALTVFRPGGDGWIRYMIEDKSGNIWIGCRTQGIWKYDGRSFGKFMAGNDIGLSALADKAGNVWFSGGEKNDGYSSDGSLWRYDGSSLKKMPAPNLGNYGVWTMLEDRSGNIWFGTRNVGLYRYDGRTFTSFSK